MKANYQDLSELTGITFKTLKKRLSGLKPNREGKSLLFNSHEALPLIFKCNKCSGKGLDLSQERARLAREQADRLELQNAERRRELVQVSDMEKNWARVGVVAIKSRALALPSKFAPELAGVSNYKEVKEILNGAIRELLQELVDDIVKMKLKDE